MLSPNKQKKEVHHFEPMDFHCYFALITVASAVYQYVFNCPFNPMVMNLFFSGFLMMFPFALSAWYFKTMYERRQFIESFFDETFWEWENHYV